MATAAFHRWNEIPLEEVTPQLHRRLLSGERLMLAHVRLAKGCVIPGHRHEHEQVTYVLAGALQFRLGEDESTERVVRADELIHFPSNVPHAAVALEETVVLDVFSPPRQDWLDRTDDYLRR